MSKLLWNPTNETLSYQFSGITYFFEPGERKKVDDACGKHLLHNLGVRGLTVLEYGCDEKALERDSLERNTDFKKKMIIDFNQRNETRKQTNFAYLAPTKEIKAYALDLGVGLLEPFEVRDKEHAAYAEMKNENDSLRESISDLTKKMAVLMEMVTAKDQGASDQKAAKQRGA